MGTFFGILVVKGADYYGSVVNPSFLIFHELDYLHCSALATGEYFLAEKVGANCMLIRPHMEPSYFLLWKYKNVMCWGTPRRARLATVLYGLWNLSK